MNQDQIIEKSNKALGEASSEQKLEILNSISEYIEKLTQIVRDAKK